MSSERYQTDPNQSSDNKEYASNTERPKLEVYPTTNGMTPVLPGVDFKPTWEPGLRKLL